MSDRKRLTERKNSRRKKRRKSADPYDMNQDRDHKEVSEYMIGDPSSFAAIPHEDMPDDEALGRNEIGLPNMPDWAYDHKDVEDWGGNDPYDNSDTFTPDDRNRQHDQGDLDQVLSPTASSDANWYEASKKKEAQEETINQLEKKAFHCVRIAENLLGEDADEESIEDQAYDLMPLPNKAIASTLSRLEDLLDGDMVNEMTSEAGDDEGEKAEESESEDNGEESKDMDEDEKEAEQMIDEVLNESTDSQAEQVVEEMTGQSQRQQRQRQPSNELGIELEPNMTTPQAANQQLDQESQQLQSILEEDLPEGAKKQAEKTQQASPEQGSSEGVSSLGGNVKQASGQDEAKELEKLWETGEDVSDVFNS